MKLKQSGIGTIETIVAIAVVAAVATGGWWVLSQDDEPTSNNSNSSQQQTAQISQELSLKSVDLTVNVPESWEVVDSRLLNPEDGLIFEEFTIEASDGYILRFTATDAPRGLASEANQLVLESLDLPSPTDTDVSYVVFEEADGGVARTYAMQGSYKPGDSTIPFSFIGTSGDPQLEIYGGYYDRSSGETTKTFDSIDSFNTQKSVSEAKEILKSMSFN